ncbi:MAG: 3-keto-disaccharide hydrolase [Dyadobacter fermentans]
MKLQLTILFSLMCLMVFGQKNNADKQEWKQLFNGKNLDGWDIKIRGYELNDNYNNTFRVEDGKMVVRYDKYDDFAQKYGHIFYKGDFSYYRVAVEYRFVGEQAPKGEGWAWRNSGVMVHGQPATTMGKDQDFPASIEVQLLGGNDKTRTTCNLCTPGTNVVIDGKLVTQHCINSKSKTYNGDQWVRAEVLVLGDSLIQHFANGEMVLEYNKPQLGGGNVSGSTDPDIKIAGKLLDHGSISLQSESHPVEFRKVEILDLKGCMDPKATNYKSYYVKADNSKCSYGKKK